MLAVLGRGRRTAPHCLLESGEQRAAILAGFCLPSHFCHCWRAGVCPKIDDRSVDQIPALLLVVAVMLAPYGVVAVLTSCFPSLTRPYRDIRVRTHDVADADAIFRRFEQDLASERR